ncbi:GNAT family N-acetyltransferase [Colwellia sp. MSW7]|uniref:GNAT family N-acetyltransferase n=1 Tax=Colwellia maritima TaxID=2912588 RepID=A0ABS9WZD9_9GAMM|nr:GNAT family N-acetyltransferase [Colwellia maritima]MCI2283170.1 GNAT family N-acetyltransferase [Colwellia maritima]
MVNIDSLIVDFTAPRVEDFLSLREKSGRQNVSAKDAKASLDNSLFHVAVYFEEQLVGMGRVVGDGVMYFYVQDIVVLPDYQGLGIGALIMQNIENYLSSTAIKGSTIGLLAVKGKEAFYARYNYIERPNASLGHGMCKFI